MTQSRREHPPGEKEARVVWDCTLGEPDKFVVRLEDIRTTMDAFEARGLRTRFAMIARGPASKLIRLRAGSSLSRSFREVYPCSQTRPGVRC